MTGRRPSFGDAPSIDAIGREIRRTRAPGMFPSAQITRARRTSVAGPSTRRCPLPRPLTSLPSGRSEAASIPGEFRPSSSTGGGPGGGSPPVRTDGARGRPAFAGRSPTITAPQGQTPADRTVTHHRPTTYQQAGERNGQKGLSHFPPVQKRPLSCGNARTRPEAAGYVRWCRRCRLRWHLRWCLRGTSAEPGGAPWVGRSTRTASPDAPKNHRPAAGARPEPNRPTHLHHQDKGQKKGLSAFPAHPKQPPTCGDAVPGRITMHPQDHSQNAGAAGVEFTDRERVRAWYDSPAYREILPLRTRHMVADAIFADGVPAG
ncbi:DUF1330 domain-containing protein [Kitasatospora aureofaciens]|uniref:DUF1330 domain-containing protein n=1 Tax=Kitasatospora aureofaciens TaxID=1894 RepID=UPI003F4D0971